MDRRSFLRGLGMFVGGIAIEQAIPLGRVWSFPSVIKPLAIENYPSLASLATVYYNKASLDRLKATFVFSDRQPEFPTNSGKTIHWKRYSA